MCVCVCVCVCVAIKVDTMFSISLHVCVCVCVCVCRHKGRHYVLHITTCACLKSVHWFNMLFNHLASLATSLFFKTLQHELWLELLVLFWLIFSSICCSEHNRIVLTCHLIGSMLTVDTYLYSIGMTGICGFVRRED